MEGEIFSTSEEATEGLEHFMTSFKFSNLLNRPEWKTQIWNCSIYSSDICCSQESQILAHIIFWMDVETQM